MEEIRMQEVERKGEYDRDGRSGRRENDVLDL